MACQASDGKRSEFQNKMAGRKMTWHDVAYVKRDSRRGGGLREIGVVDLVDVMCEGVGNCGRKKDEGWRVE